MAGRERVRGGCKRERVGRRGTSALAVFGTKASMSMPDCWSSSKLPKALTLPSSSTNTRSHMCNRCTWGRGGEEGREGGERESWISKKKRGVLC